MDFIIYFEIKNPPTVHSTSKIQPTTSPTFVFSVSASIRKKWGYERRLLDSCFGRSSSCFFILILLFHSNDMVAKTFLYIIIILCFVNKLNSSMSNFGGRLSQPNKIKLFLGISFFLPTTGGGFLILKQIIGSHLRNTV
jgi:hypothetical protein